MFKKSILFSFILILTLASNVFAQQSVHDRGFANMNWGENIAQMKDKNIDLVLLEFDRDKKLYNYVSKNSSVDMFDVVFYPIYYHFWDDRFVALRAYFDSEKDSGSFQRLYNNITAKLGIARQLDSSNADEDAMFWQTGDTSIKLTYDKINKNGTLYIYNENLQREYAGFVHTLTPAGVDYQNQPSGFQDMRWGEDADYLKSLGKKFKHNKNSAHMGEFILSGDTKDFLGTTVAAKTYVFWQNKLLCAYVYYKSDDSKETFEELYQKLASAYGEPTNGRFSDNENAQYYVWPGENTYIIIYYFYGKKESYIFFVSKKLYDEQRLVS